MNKFRIYILTILSAMLFACSQQSESFQVEESEQKNIEDDLIYITDEEISPNVSYNWEASDVEETVTIESTVSEFNQISTTEKVEANNGLSNNNNKPSSGSSATIDAGESDLSQTKLLKGFVKQNVEDIIDLTALYVDDSMGPEMNAIAKDALQAYLKGLDFEKFDNSTEMLTRGAIKLKLKELNLLENGDFTGTVLLKNGGEEMLLSYQILNTKTALGTSKKFLITQID